MVGPVDDKVECLECGGWYRSVAQHVHPAHGMTSAEYRLAHDLGNDDPLSGNDVVHLRREAALHRLEGDPDLLERMLARRGEVQGVKRGPSDARSAAMRRRRQRVDIEWEARLAEHGWSSWQDAADWAIDENVGWAEVGVLLGMSERPTQQRAADAGATTLDRRITPHQQRMVELAHEQVARHGSLARAQPRALSEWLSSQRKLVGRGVWRRVHAELDQLDPLWATKGRSVTNAPCAVEGCNAPWTAHGLCTTHYQRRKSQEIRDAAVPVHEQLECLECGQRFRAVGTHVRLMHHMTAAEYRDRHGLSDPADMNSASVLAERRRRSSTPEARAQLARAVVARWGGTADELWSGRLERAGWRDWHDVLAWALSNNAGWPEIAERLGCAKGRARERGQAAGITVPPALTEKQLRFIAMARSHVERHGDLDEPQPPELARWLTSTRQSAAVAASANRCYDALDALDPRWRLFARGPRKS